MSATIPGALAKSYSQKKSERASSTKNIPGTVVLRDANGAFEGTASSVADNAITSAKIVNDTIVDADIKSDAAISLSKLATGALPTAITVASANIVNGTITNDDVSSTAAVAHSKLANITAGQVLIGNASNVPTATALSGDVTVNSSGVTAIGSGVIVNADVNASAAIAGTKISPDFGSQNVTTTGQSAVGTSISSNAKFIVGGTMTATTSQRAISLTPSFDANGTVGCQAVLTGASTAANAGTPYTLGSITHFYANQSTFHSDSTVTSQYGLLVASSLASATNNYGVYSGIPDGATNFNIYCAGAAPNYFAGDVGINDTTPSYPLDVNGTINTTDAYRVDGTKVVGNRSTGWTAPSGTATRTTFATFAGQTISNPPTQAQVQAIDNHVKILSERVKALIDDLTTHGLLGA
jgi:hypothetical protein